MEVKILEKMFNLTISLINKYKHLCVFLYVFSHIGKDESSCFDSPGQDVKRQPLSHAV